MCRTFEIFFNIQGLDGLLFFRVTGPVTGPDDSKVDRPVPVSSGKVTTSIRRVGPSEPATSLVPYNGTFEGSAVTGNGIGGIIV